MSASTIRLTKRSAPNCWLDAPGWGRIPLVISALGYGMKVYSNGEGVSRTKRTLYPFVRTSGSWYVQAEHATRAERDTVHAWLLFYLARITDPRLNPLAPISVIVPSRDFHKVGYLKTGVEFGDSQGVSKYQSIITLASASDPDTTSKSASRYIPATNNSAFTPGGFTVSPPPSLRPGSYS